MSYRIHIGRFFLRLGSFLQTLPVVIMKPVDLVEFSRQSYDKPGDVEGWSEDILVDSGLNDQERELINSVTKQTGQLLLLGLGGGREAIPLAKMGFQVTGVDFVPAMVERAIENAEKRGVHIDCLVQEISNLDVPEASFDVVWISRAMYSCVPTRSRRIKMIQQIACALKPEGEFICQFHSGVGWENEGKSERLRRIIAKSPFGNRSYENGDILWLNIEFVHIFTAEDEIRSELEAGGLGVTQINMDPASNRGSAICVKAAHGNTHTLHKDKE